MIALFVQIELLCSVIRRLSPNRANGVAVFEGSPIRYNIACMDTHQNEHVLTSICLLLYAATLKGRLFYSFETENLII